MVECMLDNFSHIAGGVDVAIPIALRCVGCIIGLTATLWAKEHAMARNIDNVTGAIVIGSDRNVKIIMNIRSVCVS